MQWIGKYENSDCVCDANYLIAYSALVSVSVRIFVCPKCIWFEFGSFCTFHKACTNIQPQSSNLPKLLARVGHPPRSSKWKVVFHEMNAHTRAHLFICLFIAYHASIAEENLYSTTFLKSCKHNQRNPYNISYQCVQEKLSRVELNNGTLTLVHTSRNFVEFVSN